MESPAHEQFRLFDSFIKIFNAAGNL